MKKIRNMLCFLLVLCLAAMMIPSAFADDEKEVSGQEAGSAGDEVAAVPAGEKAAPTQDTAGGGDEAAAALAGEKTAPTQDTVGGGDEAAAAPAGEKAAPAQDTAGGGDETAAAPAGEKTAPTQDAVSGGDEVAAAPAGEDTAPAQDTTGGGHEVAAASGGEDTAPAQDTASGGDEAAAAQADKENVPVTAPDPANKNNEIIVVTDDDATTVQLGANTDQVFIDAEPGNINFMDSAGTETNVPTKTHAEITIPEDINVTWLDADNVFNGSPKLTVTADGEIHAADSNNNLSQAYAVSSERAGDNSIEIRVKKDVTCDATSYEPISVAVQATNDSDSDKSAMNIVLEGDLKVTATSVADSTQTEPPVHPDNGGALYRETEAHAVEADGTMQVTVKGDVTVTAQGGTVSNDATGIIAKRGANVTFEKNLTSNGTGISVDANYNPSTIIVKGDVRTAGTAVAINVDGGTSAKDLPTVIIGSIKDDKGNVVDNPEAKIAVNGNNDPDLVKQAMALICYIVDTSGVGQSVSVTGTKTASGFDGDVACDGDQITMSTGSSSVLEGVSAGAYATVTQVNDYTYIITVKHGGNLVLTGRWTPAVSDDALLSDDASAGPGTSANSAMIRVKKGSEESGTAGEDYIYEVNMKKVSQATVRVANLRKHMADKGLKYVVIRTAFGSFRVSAEDILRELEDTDTLTFRINGRNLEIYLGTELIASFEVING